MNSSMKIGLVKAITFFSILIALSGMAAIASAEEMIIVNMFYGNVTLNGADASPGTVINAYINEEPSVSFTTEHAGMYYIIVDGNASDNGGTVTFEVCGATADQTAVWHESYQYQTRVLNLTAVDDEAPAVENANANPSSIVADGVETTQLNVTVIDGCRCTVGNVTVDLSAIGGSEAQEMSRIGDTDVYSVPVTADANTALGAYCLYVNASDVFGTCNTSVCISLEVTEESIVDRYDTNDDGVISKDETIAAIMDYFDDKITKDEAIEVIMAYFG